MSRMRDSGQLGRLLDYYFPAYLEHFDRIRYFSYLPEDLSDFTSDRRLLDRVDVVAAARRRHRYVTAAALAFGARRSALRSCAAARVLQAPGALPALLAGVPTVCTYGYDYAAFTTAPRGGVPVGRLMLRGKRVVMKRVVIAIGLRWILRRADVTLATLKDAEGRARELGARSVHVLPNGVDVDLFAPADARKCYDVVFVGRLEDQKDVGTLIRALDLMPGRPRALIVGDGSRREELVAASRRASAIIEFPGTVPQERLPELLRASSIFVLPSKAEGHPKALLEAMACGLPCVISDLPGLSGLADQRVVVSFRQGDAESLSAELSSLLSDGRRADRLGQAARRKAVAEYDLRRLLRAEAKILAEVAGLSP